MKFTLNVEGFRGETFQMLDQDDMLWVEASAWERVTGLSIGELGDKDGDKLKRRSDVALAFLWVSVKRQRPQTTYSEMQQHPMGAIEWIDDEPVPEPDPTPVGDGDPTVTLTDSAT